MTFNLTKEQIQLIDNFKNKRQRTRGAGVPAFNTMKQQATSVPAALPNNTLPTLNSFSNFLSPQFSASGAFPNLPTNKKLASGIALNPYQRRGIAQISSETRTSHTFEEVHAILTPFNWPVTSNPHALSEVINTGGVIFPYNPTISEKVSVQYDSVSPIHANESFYAYKGTENPRITISDATWTCDTFENAVYALSVLHFFRTHSFMDTGRLRSGKPPSPMWFSAYGNYAYHRVPCLYESADWSFPSDVDYVKIPEVGTEEYAQGFLERSSNPTGEYTWLPVKFTISSISLIVQHSPKYWTNFNLDDYFSGKMLREKGSFHITNPPPANVETVADVPQE